MTQTIGDPIEVAGMIYARNRDRERVRDMLTDAELELDRARPDDRDAYIAAAQVVAGLRVALDLLEHRSRQRDPTPNTR